MFLHLSTEEKQSFSTAVKALQIRLDPGSCALAAQDFRNAVQWDKESVSDYITRLERSFQIVYGREHLSVETRDAFLLSQLQHQTHFNRIPSRLWIHILQATLCHSQTGRKEAKRAQTS